jgi:hypothetical protein
MDAMDKEEGLIPYGSLRGRSFAAETRRNSGKKERQ